MSVLYTSLTFWYQYIISSSVDSLSCCYMYSPKTGGTVSSLSSRILFSDSTMLLPNLLQIIQSSILSWLRLMPTLLIKVTVSTASKQPEKSKPMSPAAVIYLSSKFSAIDWHKRCAQIDVLTSVLFAPDGECNSSFSHFFW